MNKVKHNQSGVAALMTTVVIASIVLTIVLSMIIVVLNSSTSHRSFRNSLKSFYSSQAGLGEAMYQLKKEPENLVFEDLQFSGIPVTRSFVEQSGGCEPNCPTDIEATASTTDAVKKTQLSCDANISNCLWSELVP